MNRLDQAPVPERELAPSRHAAIRAMLVDAATGAPTAAPAPTRVRWTSPTRRRLALTGAVAAGLLLAMQLWPMSQDPIFEAWSPEPAALDDPLAAEAVGECQAGFADFHAENSAFPADGWQVAVIDRRGVAAAVLLDHPTQGRHFRCVMHGVGQGGPIYLAGGGATYATLAAEQVLSFEAPGGVASFPPLGVGVGQVYGQAAPSVSSVVVELENGTEVTASVDGGWYYAWWVGRSFRALLWSPVRTPAAVMVRAYDEAGNQLVELEPEWIGDRWSW